MSVKVAGWPQNPTSRALDTMPAFNTCPDVAASATLDLVEGFPLSGIMEMRDSKKFWSKLPDDVREYCQSRIDRGDDSPALSVVRVVSAAERALQMESVRATIPAEQLIGLALRAVATGKMAGSNEELKPADRARLLVALLNKQIPDAKSVEVDERADKADRKRRSLSDTSKEELSRMTENELRDLIMKAKEDA